MVRRLDLSSALGFACAVVWLLLLSPGVRVERSPGLAAGIASPSSRAR